MKFKIGDKVKYIKRITGYENWLFEIVYIGQEQKYRHNGDFSSMKIISLPPEIAGPRCAKLGMTFIFINEETE